MSHLLWKYYWDNDVERFRRLLAPSAQSSQALSQSPVIGAAGGSYPGGSPGAYGSSPRPGKPRKSSGLAPTGPRAKDSNVVLNRGDVNSRDHAGLTVLLRAASSTNPSALDFVKALLAHPAVDIYVQDPESGWNALHRSLYVGNVAIARMLLEKERADLTNHTSGPVSKVGQLIKTKDHENNSPFDVYNSTIATRSLTHLESSDASDAGSDTGDSVDDFMTTAPKTTSGVRASIEGDELFMFGSNKNLSLGVGDEDDRQYPERILLKRPDHLLHRFYQSYLDHHDMDSSATLPDLEEIPTLLRNRPLVIQDVVLSKLHTAILTTDPVSNLYICGVGRGGRLGLGDENTRFKFVPVEGPLVDKKIRHIALGQNHSMAIAGNGELWTWGLNSDSQLGYVLPPPARADEEPMSLTPRQVFGTLKKEIVQGIAASAVHSVAYTGTSLYCWGRNLGQLALMDADSRSLDIQQTPRKVAASLLSAPIEMVSAIDKATTCLLANYTVWVFSNYGYNLVKFPFPDVFTNHNLSTTSFSNRYDPGRKEISYVASGGNTIAAVTARGDLFTMELNSKADMNQPAGSTTNPVKIKGAITQPQCIWNSRKDGVVSVDVGENGSVIICTESGAVWRRVKRAKGKAAAFELSGSKQKDFKFQRVPYISNCVSVRSSIFGAFAAIRKDSKVMSEEVKIAEQSLWNDIGELLCLRDFQVTTSSADADNRKAWNAAIAREKPGSVTHELLRSPDIETELLRWLQASAFQYEDIEVQIRTSAEPDIKIPVHGWLLTGRSVILRRLFADHRRGRSGLDIEGVDIENTDGKTILTLQGVDLWTVLNFVVYLYLDSSVPVWKYTREAPPLAHRYRQVRLEVMKLATKFQLTKLEAAARLQAFVAPSLDADLQEAFADRRYFDDGDVIIELDGAEIEAHGQLICQRCPFFEGMFHGRSQGQWLADRRGGLQGKEKLRVDLKHINPDTFDYVLRYIYSDCGEEMFNNVAMPTIDDLSELILDVMSAADELMLDRLSQICQKIIAKFVTTRNIANLLNEISPFSVTSFKDTGLEYICLQLESMLENHLLDGLETDLLQELDEVVRDNQLARFPFARSGRADALLHEKYPDLAADIEEERQRRVKEFAFKASQREDEKKLSSSYKTRFGSLDESTMATPDSSRRKSRSGRNEPFSPSLRPKESLADMIFTMDDEDNSGIHTPMSGVTSPKQSRLDLDLDNIPQLPKSWRESKDKTSSHPFGSPVPGSIPPAAPGSIADASPQDIASPRGKGKTGSPWAPATLPTTKLDLKNIMSEASSTSALTASLVAAQTSKDGAANKQQTKMSQKERKRQMQLQAEAKTAAENEQANRIPWEKVPEGGRPAPWKAAVPAPKTSLKDAMSSEQTVVRTASASVKPLVASEASPRSVPRRTASPDTRFPGQGRMSSSPAVQQVSQSQTLKKPMVPHSKSYMTPVHKAEPAMAASMADIIGQQRREQELVKEAVAKRSLQEIQQEQAFQEWWDQESRRAQEEEARKQAKEKGREREREKAKDKDKDEKGGRRGRRGQGKPRASNNNSASTNANANGNGNSSIKGNGTGNEEGRGHGRQKGGGGEQATPRRRGFKNRGGQATTPA
ncbi:hypothetical protein B0I35DRAFT_408491 [Stachybotrys elegans]|uniref:BTB domain-containing protein n=1 Tax=Stachybotrys elegans TaxID=80388 RepID=A0A8K0SSN1_9HYPO|nr:hypothetical protein B0I35DRAFT_408491 [Stachybotrys elegans]